MRTKKIPYYLFLTLLTAGASLILGFLSFGGMYALFPALSLAFAAFGLSVAYEGEIYLQNIKGALGKLFKNNYLKNYLAREYLLEHFPKDTDAPDCPQFFKDYKKQLLLLAAFNHKNLTKKSKQQKKQIEKSLKDMEKLFALQLFPSTTDTDDKHSLYLEQLRTWLAQKEQKQTEWQVRLEKRRTTFRFVAGFSSLAAVFMGIGSTYLIVEAFSVIPVMAAIPFALWPLMIVPMALIAGAAYGFLTYNTITDLINNDTLNKWYKKIRHNLSTELSVRNVFIASMAVFLAVLAVALTICTAGTWWTIATSSRPLFNWMTKIPSFVMGVINPIITGLSAIFFNLQNTAESLEMLDDLTKSKSGPNFFQRIYQSIKDGVAHIRATENLLQILNPFRLLLKLTITPLRILLFMGHLVSIAFTADRMPGIPQIWAMLVALISEGFEDAHYFNFVSEHDHHSHQHKISQHSHHSDKHSGRHAHDDIPSLLKERFGAHDGHSHDADIPTRLLKLITIPLYALATVWDYLTSKLNPAGNKNHHKKPMPLTLQQAWDKQRGNKPQVEVTLPHDAKQPSTTWKVEHAIALLQKYEKKHFSHIVIGNTIAEEKKQQLRNLQQKVREKGADSLAQILEEAKADPTFNRHRLFARKGEKADTQLFIEELPARLGIAPAA